MTKLEKAWLAGFFDGEGCIHPISYKKKGPTGIRITLGQKFPNVLYYIKGLLKFGQVNLRNNRRTHSFQVANKTQCQRFIEIILPYSIVKRKQLEIGLQYIKLIGSVGYPATKENHIRRIELAKELKRLKRVESVKKLKSHQS